MDSRTDHRVVTNTHRNTTEHLWSTGAFLAGQDEPAGVVGAHSDKVRLVHRRQQNMGIDTTMS